MSKFLDDIRSQPEHIREMYAGLCTVVVVAVVLMIWFHSFKQNVYALLNPDEQTQTRDQFFASNNAPSSLFGYIGQAVSASRATIADLLKGNVPSGSNSQTGTATHDSGQVHVLPISGNR